MMAIELSVAFVTVTGTVVETVCVVTVINAAPPATPWTIPALLTAAVEGLLLVKVDDAVRFALFPLL